MNPSLSKIAWNAVTGRLLVRYESMERSCRREETTGHLSVDLDELGAAADVDLSDLPLPDVDRLAAYAASRARPPVPSGIALDREARSLWLHLSPRRRRDTACGRARVWLSFAGDQLVEVEAQLVRRCAPTETPGRRPLTHSPSWRGSGRRLMLGCDLDGTLLDPAGKITIRTRHVIAAVRRAGHAVVIATGRPVRDVRQVVSDLGGDVISICGNGSISYDVTAERVLSYHPIGAEDVHSVLDRVRTELPAARFGAERGLDLLLEDGFELEAALCAGARRLPQLSCEVDHRGVGKIIVQAPGPSSQYCARVAQVLPPGCRATVSGDQFCEVTRSDVDKATALHALAQRMGILPGDLVVFGDMPNDLPMMLGAGWSVAVANAHPRILAAADEVTSSNADDGVAAWLERRVLTGMKVSP